MERRNKLFIAILSLALLLNGVVPFTFSQAQSGCNPDALKPVSQGQRGNEVRNVQECLMEAGYDIPAGATGYYGKQTVEAVKAFYADWYGSWHGKNIGPKGIATLKSLIASLWGEEEVVEEDQTGQQQPGNQPSQQTDIAAIVAAVLAALQQSGVIPSVSTTTTGTAQQEGFLVVEQDPSATGVTVREGESANVFGLRFRADNGSVTVKSIFLRWTGSSAPYRVLSNLALVDSQGNVLYQTAVTPSTFLQDSNLNYYLPVTGLNVNVPVGQYTSVFVKVTVVNTLPSGVTSAGFAVNQNDVRAVDGVGVDRFGPVSNISGTFTLQASLAQSADWVVARNPNTPKEGYIFGDVSSGKVDRAKLLSFDLTSKNDNLRLTSVVVTTGGSSNMNMSALYLKYGDQTLDVRSPSTTVTFNAVPANFVVNKDQTVTLDVVADLQGGSTTTEATTSVTVASVTGLNSLGGTVSKSVSVAGDTLHYRTLGPEVSGFTANPSYTPPSQTASSSYSVVIRFNVTPRGGTVYMGTTTAPTSSFAAVELEKSGGATSTPNAGVTVKVYQGSTDVTNSLTVGGSGLFALSENQTYTFEITAAQNGAPSGTGLYRWVVSNLKWHDGASTQTVTWTSRDMYTSYTNVQ